MNDEQVERVAKAIAEWFACPWTFLLDAQREGYRSEARAAIAAMQPDAQAIRNAALREAANICLEYSKDHGRGMFDRHSAECERLILALIKENTDEQ